MHASYGFMNFAWAQWRFIEWREVFSEILKKQKSPSNGSLEKSQKSKSLSRSNFYHDSLFYPREIVKGEGIFPTFQNTNYTICVRVILFFFSNFTGALRMILQWEWILLLLFWLTGSETLTFSVFLSFEIVENHW